MILFFYNRTMDQQDLYDEFGNYIGPDIDSASQQPQQGGDEGQIPAGVQQVLPVANQHRIVLHQDKKYYQTHQQLYPGAQIMIEQQDRQTLETPLVSTEHQKSYDYQQPLETYYQTQYLLDLMSNPKCVRNVCVVGHFHHGKTLLLDLLIQQTHLRRPNWNLDKNYRWLDSRVDQQQRQLSIKASPITLLLPQLRGKNYVFNFMDTPGHPNFLGEVVAGLRACDGAVLVVDAIQGVMLMTQKLIKHILRQKMKVVVVINKIDRLIVQMKIPPEDAYLKLKYTLQQINGLFLKYSQQLGMNNPYRVSPVLGNVVFASAQYGFMFTLESFAQKYKKIYPGVDQQTFKKLLWGDYYFERSEGKFQRKPQTNSQRKRTFVQFVLDPIYKIFAHTVGKDRRDLEGFLSRNLGIGLTAEEYKLNIKAMIKLIMERYFGQHRALPDSIVKTIPQPTVRAGQLVSMYYRGVGDFKNQIGKGHSQGPLLLNIVKMYHTKDYKSFYAFGRVISGKIKKNDELRIMGQNYMSGDDQDMFVRRASKLCLLQGRYRIQVNEVVAGNLVLIQGIDQAITKTATIVHTSAPRDVDIMIPLKYWSQPTIKISIQPLIPNQLPKMIQAIRRVNKSYLLLKTKVQQSGEHVLIGNGEMHLDCILHDIRNLYSDIQCRISDPTVIFSQTVIQTSGIPCYADTPNKKNRLKALAGPLQRNISEHVQKQLLDINNKKVVQTYLQQKYDWDILAASNVWSFGPQHYGSNILINDSLPSMTDQSQLQRVKQSVIQGFRWSTRQGPLCDQPIRNTKFRVIQAQLSKNIIDCPPGQMIPTSRRAFYSAFLTANPRLMQPVYYTEIQCTTKQSIDAVFAVLAKRRGSVQNDIPKVGTPHYIIKALVPCIQALGFQTDLRVHTVGQAFCLTTFDHWQILPGDPLDKRVILRPLQVLQPHQLARQFMVKTRRRKGLNEQVSIVKYFDDLNIKQLLRNDATFKDFI